MKNVRITLIMVVSAVLLALLLEGAGARLPHLLRSVGDSVERTVTQRLITVWVEQ